MKKSVARQISAEILAWYDRHRRELPWRARPGETPDPYRVWVSEIMLQQTTVAAVAGYFRAFMERWPTVGDLEAADLDDVLHAWQGLGYYARARNLHKCARQVAAEHGGRFPDTVEGLQALPGIGPYTAAAIATIAFDRDATAVDGNVERVMARIFAVETLLPTAKTTLRGHARELTPAARFGDYAQAVMDLGATICTPKSPACSLCPVVGWCAAAKAGNAERYPRKAPKTQRPVRSGTVFWLTDGAGRVLLRRRAESGLLGGMMEFPSTDWRETPPSDGEIAGSAPADAAWRALPDEVGHTFTHFHLRLRVLAGKIDGARPPDGVWCPLDRLGEHALPTVMKKVARHALTHTRD